MSGDGLVKAFLNEWCQKNSKQPEFDVRAAGPKHRQRFLCELRIAGIGYVGAGNSTNKKDAQTNAAKDFVQYLVRSGQVNERDVPVEDLPGVPLHQDSGPDGHERTYRDVIADQKRMEDAEDLDVNAGIHGNWTIENAKSKLHQFLQLNKIKTDYKYSILGSGSISQSFVCEMGFYVKQLGRNIHARETGSNKQSASKSCALSLVRQLYHLNVIEAFSGTLARPKNDEILKPYEVKVDPELMAEVNEVLETLQIVPQPVNKVEADSKEPVSLVSNQVLEEFIASTANLDQISEDLLTDFSTRMKSDTRLQSMVTERSKLPVFSKRNEIMSMINDNSVCIIRGNTGSGKTTQICQFILDEYLQSGQGAYCNIVVTQPRRISAVSVADRVANERAEELGQSTGYSVRFESALPRPYGGIMFCTVGVLLRKLEGGLRGVSHVIVDEIHERDVNSDFIMVTRRCSATDVLSCRGCDNGVNLDEMEWSFVCEMGFYVKQLGRNIHARETGSNKQSASKSCALSLVRQLYHLNVIEAFSGTLARPKNDEILKPYEVKVDPELMAEVNEVLETLQIVPQPVNKVEADSKEPVSLVSNQVLEEFIASKPQPASVVPWSPPQTNWNPWTACNIDEGPLATANLDQISEDLLTDFSTRMKSDTRLQSMVTERSKLPVFSKRNEIMSMINDNSVCIIRGNTGSGKTTQICQFILDEYLQSGQGAYCNIVVTQPRRISAVSVADRVANERAEELGQSTGYSVRFESALPRPYGGIMFCTAGVLLQTLHKGLRGVSHVIVDEIHERDVNSDFIMVVLRDMVHMYPDLRIILMSATIDTSAFSKYFNDCPVLEVPGRTHPVTDHFLEDIVEILNFVPQDNPRKRKNKSNKRDDDDEEDGLIEEEENMNNQVSNDYSLNFVPQDNPRKRKNKSNKRDDDDEEDGLIEEEENMNNQVSNDYSPQTRASVAQLSERDISFELIESLLKYIKQQGVDGAVLVFLPGWNVIFILLRQRLYSNISNSKVSMELCLYFYPGGMLYLFCFDICLNIPSLARYDKLDDHMTPEMFRTPLHEISLSIKLLRLGSIGQFLSKAIEPPPIDAVIEAEVMLREMKCLDANDELTPLGKILARLPLEPRLGKMLLLGSIFNCGDALNIVAASASGSNEIFVTERRLSYAQRAFAGSRYSDFVAVINAFNKWDEIRQSRGPQAEEAFCEQKQLSVPTLRVTWETKNQLTQLLMNCGFPEESFVSQFYNYTGPDEKLDTVIALLCVGLYPNVCVHQTKRKVFTTEAKNALIHKLSVNCSNLDEKFPSPFFIFGEKIRTKAVSCKQMSMVTPLHLMLFGSRKVRRY
ncbi:LOW QUALITY PROTEIN: ATP-dependent RNA helicase A-like [Diaphorina citri]|uniref:RNA helicase n=2 Tax=Diaphorina citri TaxID=121845 RepID=A0A3Q0IQ25_DIACI|nr:LOW QUALITY PROTEIN: ATP-dependent RNA helicase A-like [Diaphorina citri]